MAMLPDVLRSLDDAPSPEVEVSPAVRALAASIDAGLAHDAADAA